MRQGVIPSQLIEKMINANQILINKPLQDDQVQPASLDLRLGKVAYRIRASFLTGDKATVTSRLAEFQMHEIDLSQGAVLEKGCVYLVPLMESLDLPDEIEAVANAKSSTGRLDLLTRTITDYGKEFDRIVRLYGATLC